MADEHRCQDGHRLCRNSCGFFGNPATLDLCSKCYRDRRLKEDQPTSSSPSVAANERPLYPSPTSWKRDPDALPDIWLSSSAPTVDVGVVKEEELAVASTNRLDRCTRCKKRVGLTGFKCRCGTMYCGAHRYPESHACSYDFKKAGREEIARANPVVKAAKLERI